MGSHSLVQSCPDNHDRETLNSSCEVGRETRRVLCALYLWLCSKAGTLIQQLCDFKQMTKSF